MEEEKPKKKTRGGRPKLGEKQLKSKRVTLNFTPAEWERIEEEMKEVKYIEPGIYLRKKLTAREGQLIYNPREALNALEVLGSEVMAIGKNINQIARYVNYLKSQGAVKPEVMEKYSELLGELTKAELKMQKVVRGFFRKGDKVI